MAVVSWEDVTAETVYIPASSCPCPLHTLLRVSEIVSYWRAYQTGKSWFKGFLDILLCKEPTDHSSYMSIVLRSFYGTAIIWRERDAYENLRQYVDDE